MIQPCVKGRSWYAIWIYRYDLKIYDGSRGQHETFVRGNGVPRDLWHCTFRLRFFQIILTRLL